MTPRIEAATERTADSLKRDCITMRNLRGDFILE